MRRSTVVMIAFAVMFGLLAVFLAQSWINRQAEQRLRSLEANRKPAVPARTIVVASRPLRFGEVLTAPLLREMPWPQNALPAGAFGKIAELTAAKRVVLMPIEVNEAVLASKITGPGQRATLSAMLHEGMTAVTIRVNDAAGVAGFVLPGDHVDVVLTRQRDKNTATNDVVIQNARVLAVDQLADEKAQKPSVVKTVTLEVSVVDGQKVALASTVGTLSLLLRKAGESDEAATRRVTQLELGQEPLPVQAKPAAQAPAQRFATIEVVRRGEKGAVARSEYKVPIEGDNPRALALTGGQQRSRD